MDELVAAEEPASAPEAQPLASTSESRDPDRFNCPFPGCNRSFAELWRLKVHYRAPPDVRGSGKERGHGTELEFCPKCAKQLKPGKHHVGCAASKRQSKRPRQHADQDGGRPPRSSTGDSKTGIKPEELHEAWVAAGGMAFPAGGKLPHPPLQHQVPGFPGAYYYAPAPNGMQPMPMWSPSGAAYAMMPLPAGAMPMQPQHYLQQPQLVAFHPHSGMPHVMPYQHVLMAPSQPQPSLGAAPAMPTPSAQEQPSPRDAQLAGMFDHDDDEDVDLARMPSPPPLPPDFSGQQQEGPVHAQGPSQLFNFGQFQQRMPSTQPLLTGPNKLVKDMTQEALDLAKANVVYETHDDGDLMELLFGVADEMPTMATFHLHKFSSEGLNHTNHQQHSSPPPTPGTSGVQQQQQQQQQQQMASPHGLLQQGQQQQQQQLEWHQPQHMVVPGALHQQLEQHQQGRQQGHQQGHQRQQHSTHHSAFEASLPLHAIKQELQHHGASHPVGVVADPAPNHSAGNYAHTPANEHEAAGSTESVFTKESMMNNAERWRETHNQPGNLPSGLFDCG